MAYTMPDQEARLAALQGQLEEAKMATPKDAGKIAGLKAEVEAQQKIVDELGTTPVSHKAHTPAKGLKDPE